MSIIGVYQKTEGHPCRHGPDNPAAKRNTGGHKSYLEIVMLSTWRHSGFHVFCRNRISPTDDMAMENLARYIILASFSQESMQYLDQEGADTIYGDPEYSWDACQNIP